MTWQIDRGHRYQKERFDAPKTLLSRKYRILITFSFFVNVNEQIAWKPLYLMKRADQRHKPSVMCTQMQQNYCCVVEDYIIGYISSNKTHGFMVAQFLEGYSWLCVWRKTTGLMYACKWHLNNIRVTSSGQAFIVK